MSLLKRLLQGSERRTGRAFQKLDAAAALVLAGQFGPAIEAYEQIIVEHPEEASVCHSQIGTAHFFLGNHELALDSYEQAKRHGADAGIMDDHIREAWEAIQAVGHA